MPLRMHKIQVWTGEIPDRAGAAAAQLELLARAGADLEFVFTRPIANQPDKVAIFLAPIQGNEQLEAARLAGLAPARDIAMVCVEGENRSGIGYEIMSRLAIAGINLRGLVMSVIHGKFVGYVTFDSVADANRAATILAELGTA